MKPSAGPENSRKNLDWSKKSFLCKHKSTLEKNRIIEAITSKSRYQPARDLYNNTHEFEVKDIYNCNSIFSCPRRYLHKKF